jgi:GxxExxY protein
MKENFLYSGKTEKIIGIYYKVYNTLGSGFLEKVYENALLLELTEAGFKVEKQVPIEVYYKNKIIGNYYSDLIIDDTIILEIKAVDHLCDIHEAQLTHYLKATNLEVGLLLNFGEKPSFKRKVYLNLKKNHDRS